MLPYLAAVIAAASLTACSEQKHEEITITQDETGTAGVISIDLEAQADGTARLSMSFRLGGTARRLRGGSNRWKW